MKDRKDRKQISISKRALARAKALADLRETSFSGLLDELIREEYERRGSPPLPINSDEVPPVLTAKEQQLALATLAALKRKRGARSSSSNKK